MKNIIEDEAGYDEILNFYYRIDLIYSDFFSKKIDLMVENMEYFN
jgi:hypothetical protein